MIEIFKAIVEALLPLIPHAEMVAALDEIGRKRSDAIADLAEDVKFPREP